LPDGTSFSVGTGFSDAQRENPPAIGSVVTFRYQELSDRGVPRFPSFVRVCPDPSSAQSAAPPSVTASDRRPQAALSSSAVGAASEVEGGPISSHVSGTTRRFEYAEGKSAKFWEISIEGGDVTVRFGRLGTQGQSQTKSFAGADAAARHAEKLIGEKTKKGYVET
jgi:DNA ligase-1